MGVLFERSEFRPFSNDGHSQRNGNFGRPPFTMPKRFARNQRFRLSAYLDSFFFGGAKKNEYSRVRGTRSGILVAQKEKVNSIGKRQAYRTRKGLKGSAPYTKFFPSNGQLQRRENPYAKREREFDEYFDEMLRKSKELRFWGNAENDDGRNFAGNDSQTSP